MLHSRICMFPCLNMLGKIDHRRHEHNKFRISQYISCPMQYHCYKLWEFGAMLACKSSPTMSSNCPNLSFFLSSQNDSRLWRNRRTWGCSQFILHGTFTLREGVQVVEYHLFSHTLFYNTLLVWISPEQFSIFFHKACLLEHLISWSSDPSSNISDGAWSIKWSRSDTFKKAKV